MEQTSLPKVEELLAQLEPSSSYYPDRMLAVKQASRLDTTDVEIVRALIRAKNDDPSYQIRKSAAEALCIPVYQAILRQHPDLLKAAGSDLVSLAAVPTVAQEGTAGPTALLSPWLTIWIWPRKTIRQIVAADPTYLVTLLAVLAGLAQALARASSENLGDRYSLPTIFLLCAILGPVGGLISLYIMGTLLRWTGSWLGGVASSQEVRAALAWSSVPRIWAMLLWIPYLTIFRAEMFTSAMPRTEASLPLSFLLLGFGLVEIVITLWAFVVLLKCLGEVHRFSAWRALGATMLCGLLLALPLVCLVVGVLALWIRW